MPAASPTRRPVEAPPIAPEPPRRVQRERSETYNRVVAEIARKLLPVVDNLGRALEAERSIEADESKEFRHFLHGVELINKQLSEVLQSLGIETIAADASALRAVIVSTASRA